MLERVDPTALTHERRVDRLVELERARAFLDAEQQRVLAAMDADPTPVQTMADVRAKQRVREEVACALRLSFGVAADRLAVACELVRRLPASLRALEQGSLTMLQARALVDAVLPLSDLAADAVQARVLPRADQQTVGEFRRSVMRAVLSLDRDAAETRHERAVADRRVDLFPGDDGMATAWRRYGHSCAQMTRQRSWRPSTQPWCVVPTALPISSVPTRLSSGRARRRTPRASRGADPRYR